MNFRLIAMWDYILYFFFGVRVVIGGVLLGFFRGVFGFGFFSRSDVWFSGSFINRHLSSVC